MENPVSVLTGPAQCKDRAGLRAASGEWRVAPRMDSPPLHERPLLGQVAVDGLNQIQQFGRVMAAHHGRDELVRNPGLTDFPATTGSP